MKHARAIAIFLLLLSAHSDAEDSASFEEQVAEYIRRYPYQRTYDYVARYSQGDPAKLNVWAIAGEPRLVTAGNDIVPRTNHDTFYQAANVWLGDGPVVLASDAPSEDRFNSFQLIDERNANYRNVIHPKGEYTLYFGAKPHEIHGEAIDVPSLLSIVIVRVEVKDETDPEDVAAAKTVINGMTITGKRPADFPHIDVLGGFEADVVAEANRRMDEAFVTVPFRETIVGPGQAPGRDVPFLYHAAGTKGGFGGPDPRHSAYEVILLDGDGEPIKGRNGTYTVVTEEPPVDGFWSVTVYDTERGGFLHPNERDRYHINGTSAERNPDGTVTFTFKQECDETDSNCLDVPAGRFDVVPRYYLPRDEIASGAWTFPKIELVTE
jgi:hypothetical protein